MTEFHPKLHQLFPSLSSVPKLLGGRNSVTIKAKGIDSFMEVEYTQNND